MKTTEILTLRMRNGAVGIGGYPTKVHATVCNSASGERVAYVSRRIYRAKIQRDPLVCATATDGTPIIPDLM